jgi:hypothetical protein
VEFFADRNLGRYDFPATLREAGIVVHAHDDHFPPASRDVEWLQRVAARGWIVLSADRDILRDRFELAAVMTSQAAMLCLLGGDAKTSDLARNFVNTYPKIAEFVAAHTPPYVAKVYRPSPVSDVVRGVPGSLALAMDYACWLASRRSLGFRP